MAHKKQRKGIGNQRARFDYDISEEIIAGIVLTGAETKSIRMGSASLRGSFATIKAGELWLNNLQVTPLKTNQKDLPEQDRTRPRKLLVTKKQLHDAEAARQQGRSIVPIRLLSEGRYIKVVLGIGKGKKKYDKREAVKKRDQQRQIARELA